MSRNPARYCRRRGCYLPDRQQKCLACGAWDNPEMLDTSKEPHRITYVSAARISDVAILADKLSDVAIRSQCTLYADDKPVEALEYIQVKE